MFQSRDAAGGKFREVGMAIEDSPVVSVERNTRLPLFYGVTADVPSRLAQLKVFVVGVGSVGLNIVIHLARLAVHTLWIADPGSFKRESLLTHPVGPALVGERKAPSAGRLAKAISPRTRVLVFPEKLEELEVSCLDAPDLVVLASDNLSVEAELGQRCLNLRKPLLQASVHGETLVAQVRSFSNLGEGACPACHYGTEEWNQLNRETIFSCEGHLTGDEGGTTSSEPTMSTSFLSSMAADLLMTQLMRHVLGLEEPLSDSVVEYCGFNHRSTLTRLRRNPRCPCDHLGWKRVHVGREFPECTVGDLLAVGGFTEGSDLSRYSFSVEGHWFVRKGSCRCGVERDVERFVNASEYAGQCSACGDQIQAWGFFSHQEVPASLLSAHLGRTLGELGAESATAVVVRQGERGAMIKPGPPPRLGESQTKSEDEP